VRCLPVLSTCKNDARELKFKGYDFLNKEAPMRHGYSSITPAIVHRHAQEALKRALNWQPYHQSVTVTDMLRLLLLMAANNSSLFATARRFFSFCHETASRAINAQLPSQDRLTAGLVDALVGVATFSAGDRKRRWLVAIDTHNVAYYGRRTEHVIGGQKKQGTHLFFSYATAVLIHKHRRYTVGLMALLPGYKQHEIVRTLLDQIAQKGLKIRGVALDSAFGSGDTLLLLQERKLAYAVPLPHVGQAGSVRNRLFAGKHRQIRWTEWTTDRSRRHVKTRTFLWKGTGKTLLFAFDGWSGERAGKIHQTAERQRQLYKKRFGIETSYRQKNQAQARTTRRDPVYRLLLEGVAYLLRQVWVVLTQEIARRTHAKPSDWIGSLTLELLLDWLVNELKKNLTEKCSIPLDTIS
jgi:hypothetical protein